MSKSDPPTCRLLDQLEEELRQIVAQLADGFDDEVLARKYLLARTYNERDRAVFEILLRQSPTTNGKRSGRRKSFAALRKDEEILNGFEEWQKGRNALGSDRQFAIWWHKHEPTVRITTGGWYRGIVRETKGDATEADIKRITKRLRDARRRVEHQSS
jgi:hypothetical protein